MLFICDEQNDVGRFRRGSADVPTLLPEVTPTGVGYRPAG